MALRAGQRVRVEQLLERPRVEHPVGGHLALDGPLAAVAQPVELAGGVRVGIDREDAARLDRLAQQPFRWIEPLRPGVDLDGDAVLGAGGEHGVGVELRLGALAVAHDHAARAVAQHVDERVLDRPSASARSSPPPASAASSAREATTMSSSASRSGSWSRRAVLVDVDLDPGEHPEPRAEGHVELGDLVELAPAAAPPRGRWRRSAAASGR